MDETRSWYKEPESFIALAAPVVSISAVAVGMYEASLQRAHDRAETWPRIDVATFTSQQDATVSIANNGIGPAVIENVVVSVDGKARRNWEEVLDALVGSRPKQFSHYTVGGRAMRAGENSVVLSVPINDLPPNFWSYIGRVGIEICYRSVFDERWELDGRLSRKNTLRRVSACQEQPEGVEF
jgi:hypothetical protein